MFQRISISSGGSVVRPPASRVLEGDAILPETLLAGARYGLFIPNRLQEQVLDALEIKNPVRFRTGLLVVDYVSEISNLDLMGDILTLSNAFP